MLDQDDNTGQAVPMKIKRRENDSKILTAFGEALREARTDAGITQEELGRRIGGGARSGAAWIAHYEAGKRAPSLTKLRALVLALDIDPADLLALDLKGPRKSAR
jgi:transcriptional regulator with XRE-family HTH domain